MTDRKARMRELIEAFDGSTSLQVEAIMHLFDWDNVAELAAAMPDGFREHFAEWCSLIRAGGAPLENWEPEFARGFDAVCKWLDTCPSTNRSH